MVNRIQDYHCFDDKTFAELEAKLNIKNKTYDNQKTAELHQAITGGTIDKINNTYIVTTPTKIDFNKAMDNNLFKKVGWGEYLYAGFTGTQGFTDKYNFDDGSIWYVQTDEQGNEFLVKQVDDKDELVRVASNNSIIKANNLAKMAQILNIEGVDSKTVAFLKQDTALIKRACVTVNTLLTNYVKDYVSKKHYVEDKQKLKTALKVIGNTVDNIANKQYLNIVIDKIWKQ